MSIKLFLVFVITLFITSAGYSKDIEQWGRFELSITGPAPVKGSGDLQLSARFIHQDTVFVVPGFYDGARTYRVRFMPQLRGNWQYETISNIPQFNGRRGSFRCVKPPSNNRGMVKVSNTYNFQYADGSPYFPFGTTAYAWTHMAPHVQDLTIATLKSSGFNKVRMCVFPKNYSLVTEEPTLYPFEVKEVKKNEQGEEYMVWDYDRFNPLFFRHLEKRIDDLAKIGVEADLILFHPYDKGRWGFDSMPQQVNIRYIKYLSARLSSFRNVWWSLANEWNYVKSKTRADWGLLTKTVVEEDPYRHLCSIHGATATYYDYWKPEYTHVSVQDETPVQSPNSAALLRNVYHKPVVLDEVGYEGNLKSRWGRYSPEEMTYLVWNGVMGGAYVTHGECYDLNEANTLFWAKGGDFKGESWKRIAFLRNLLEESPAPLQLTDISRDNQTASAGEGCYFVYFGTQVQDSWLFNLPAKNAEFENLKPGTCFKVEIIDTYDMTVQSVQEVFETAGVNNYRLFDKDMKSIRLPLKPYIALRITKTGGSHVHSSE